jgi:2'-5' RNA ligase
MARAFVAVVPDREVVASIAAEVATTRAELERAELERVAPTRWVEPSQLHITLAFLGDDADLDDVAVRLAGFTVPAFVASLRGLGAFPRPRAARVLWMGVCDGRSEMAGASAAIHARLGVQPDQRFTPHLTLARSRVPRDLAAVIGREGRAIEWRISEIVLFESTLATSGSSHHAHLRIPLS